MLVERDLLLYKVIPWGRLKFDTFPALTHSRSRDGLTEKEDSRFPFLHPLLNIWVFLPRLAESKTSAMLEAGCDSPVTPVPAGAASWG